MSKQIRQLHNALIDLVGMMNRPQRDTALIREAGISLDRALFPLLVGIERKGPIGVGELADRVGRDYTTVSRQVAKLESSGLVARRPSKGDKRVREATITAKGRAMTNALDAARERVASILLADWSKKDLRDLARLMRRFADDLLAWRT
jgi:DNA-binding MarR family transcriptional regulator